MSNGDDTQAQNCAAGVCCDDENGPGSDQHKRIKSLIHILHHDLGDSPYNASEVATWLDGKFDLAGKGTLYAFKQWVVKLHEAGSPE